MSKIVRTIANLFVPFILMFGAYIIIHGHITPGGGFQGGAVFASGIALLVVAYNSSKVQKYLKESRLSIIESSGALMFIGLAFAGLAVTFFFNILIGSPLFGQIPPVGSNPGFIWTAGVIPLMNIAVGLKVIAGLSSIVLVMALASSNVRIEE
jgi:energy-converting hydrogenase B subunit I